MSGGLIALTVEECDRLLAWSEAVFRRPIIGPMDRALEARLREWRERHSTEVHVRGD